MTERKNEPLLIRAGDLNASAMIASLESGDRTKAMAVVNQLEELDQANRKNLDLVTALLAPGALGILDGMLENQKKVPEYFIAGSKPAASPRTLRKQAARKAMLESK